LDQGGIVGLELSDELFKITGPTCRNVGAAALKLGEPGVRRGLRIFGHFRKIGADDEV
jgi:hypothetical protein